MVSHFCTEGNIKMWKAQGTLIPKQIACINSWEMNISSTGFLLHINLGMPFPAPANIESFCGINSQHIEKRSFLLQLIKVSNVQLITDQVVICTQMYTKLWLVNSPKEV